VKISPAARLERTIEKTKKDRTGQSQNSWALQHGSSYVLPMIRSTPYIMNHEFT